MERWKSDRGWYEHLDSFPCILGDLFLFATAEKIRKTVHESVMFASFNNSFYMFQIIVSASLVLI